MKTVKLKTVLIVCSLIFILSLTTIFGGCDKDGEPLSNEDIDALAAVVTDLYDEQALYINGNFTLKFDGTTTYSGMTTKNASNADGEISGAIEYNETTQNFDMLDADVFITAKETNEKFAQAYYVRNGLLFRQFYLGYDKSLADFKKECQADKEKTDLVYLYDIKDKFLPGGSGEIGINSLGGNVPDVNAYSSCYGDYIDALLSSLLSSPSSEASERIVRGYVKGMSEHMSITKKQDKSGVTYTFDAVKTYTDLFDKTANLLKFLAKSSDSLTIGELFKAKEFKALASPILKNIAAKDVVDVLSNASDNMRENIIIDDDGKITLKIDEGYDITFAAPGNYTLEEYIEKVVLETNVKNGYANVKIKDIKVSAITGGASGENTSEIPNFSYDQALNELEKEKKELLDALKTAKFSLIVKNNKITGITAEIAMEISDELIPDENRPNEKYVSENKISVTLNVSVIDKAPSFTFVPSSAYPNGNS